MLVFGWSFKPPPFLGGSFVGEMAAGPCNWGRWLETADDDDDDSDESEEEPS